MCVYNVVICYIAMENGLCIDDFPIKTFIYKGFSMAMLNNQMVIATITITIHFDYYNDNGYCYYVTIVP